MMNRLSIAETVIVGLMGAVSLIPLALTVWIAVMLRDVQATLRKLEARVESIERRVSG